MDPRVHFSAEAESDLVGIVDRQADNPAAAAKKALDGLESAIDRLAEFPRSGHLNPRVTSPGTRMWSVGNWLVIYRPRPGGILVLRIVDGRRRTESLVIPD